MQRRGNHAAKKCRRQSEARNAVAMHDHRLDVAAKTPVSSQHPWRGVEKRRSHAAGKCKRQLEVDLHLGHPCVCLPPEYRWQSDCFSRCQTSSATPQPAPQHPQSENFSSALRSIMTVLNTVHRDETEGMSQMAMIHLAHPKCVQIEYTSTHCASAGVCLVALV